MNAQTRPALRYHGGKWRLAPWIIAHFPPHRTYVEPFGGAASVLLRKPRAYAEVYNDLDADVVNLFRVLRSPLADSLREALALTPYARAEFDLAYLPSDDAVERARRLVVRSFMGFGSSGCRKHKTGFRASVQRSGTVPAGDWRGFPDALPALIDRLRGVVIEQMSYVDLLPIYASPDTLFYLDPPYLFSTRSQKRIRGDLYHGYRHELDDDGHVQLLDLLTGGGSGSMIILSGYPSELYDRALVGWQRVQMTAVADGAGARTEVLWINPQAAERIPQRGLFDALAAMEAA